ncbi:DUF2933 domain-containing protein [Sphingobium sp. Sx8-8]|uniref:DUF2933 domain-containing protein n=1 Tax=Sphingobium sp. Sx8-8 TaxID=2933617 RepID=UPI001F5A9B68
MLLGFMLLGAFYLFTEYRAHLLGMLPYLIFLACPAMHLFMHRSHVHHGSGGSPKRDERASSPSRSNREMPS